MKLSMCKISQAEPKQSVALQAMSRRPPAVPLFGSAEAAAPSQPIPAPVAPASPSSHSFKDYQHQYSSLQADALQKEVDAEMEMRVSQMRVEAQMQARNLQRKFQVELSRLPDFVRGMTLVDFLNQSNGTGEVSVLVQNMSKVLRNDFDSWVEEVHTPRRSARILQSAKKKDTSARKTTKRKAAGTQNNEFNPPLVPEFSMDANQQTPAGSRRPQRAAKLAAQNNIAKTTHPVGASTGRRGKKVSTIPEVPEFTEPMTPAPTTGQNSKRGAGSIAVTNHNKLVLDEEFSTRLNRVDPNKKNAILSRMAELQRLIETEVDLPPED